MILWMKEKRNWRVRETRELYRGVREEECATPDKDKDSDNASGDVIFFPKNDQWQRQDPSELEKSPMKEPKN